MYCLRNQTRSKIMDCLFIKGIALLLIPLFIFSNFNLAFAQSIRPEISTLARYSFVQCAAANEKEFTRLLPIAADFWLAKVTERLKEVDGQITLYDAVAWCKTQIEEEAQKAGILKERTQKIIDAVIERAAEIAKADRKLLGEKLKPNTQIISYVRMNLQDIRDKLTIKHDTHIDTVLTVIARFRQKPKTDVNRIEAEVDLVTLGVPLATAREFLTTLAMGTIPGEQDKSGLQERLKTQGLKDNEINAILNYTQNTSGYTNFHSLDKGMEKLAAIIKNLTGPTILLIEEDGWRVDSEGKRLSDLVDSKLAELGIPGKDRALIQEKKKAEYDSPLKMYFTETSADITSNGIKTEDIIDNYYPLAHCFMWWIRLQAQKEIKVITVGSYAEKGPNLLELKNEFPEYNIIGISRGIVKGMEAKGKNFSLYTTNGEFEFQKTADEREIKGDSKNIPFESGKETRVAPYIGITPDSILQESALALEPKRIIADIESTTQEIITHDMLKPEGPIDLSKIAIVMKKGLTDAFAEGKGTTITQTMGMEYKKMKQELAKRFSKVVEVSTDPHTDEWLTTINALTYSGLKVIVLDDGTLNNKLSANSLYVKGRKGEDYCVILAEAKEHLDADTIQLVNLNAMALMGVGVFNKDFTLFSRAYKLFTGKEIPESITTRWHNSPWDAVYGAIPRIVKLTGAIADREIIERLFSVSA